MRATNFVVAATERVACKGDVTVLCTTGSVRGTLYSQAVTAPAASGGSITIRADKAITVSGTIRAGSGVGGRIALHEVSIATSPTNGGNGGSVELVSATDDLALAKGAQLAGGDGGAGAQSLNGGAGGDGGSITLRCVNGALTLAQGPKLFHVGNGGAGGDGEVQGQDLLTFDLPSKLANGGGDSGMLRAFCKRLVGVQLEASTWPGTQRRGYAALLNAGVADGGAAGGAGDFAYGLDPETGRSTWPRNARPRRAGPTYTERVGAPGGNGHWTAGNAGTVTVAQRPAEPDTPGLGASAIGGKGGDAGEQGGVGGGSGRTSWT